MREKITAGIVTYQPDLVTLRRTVRSIAPQVEQVVVVDNGSADRAGIRALCREEGARLVLAKRNGGLGRAYNFLIRDAKKRGHAWVTLLDQDTECPPDLIQKGAVHRKDPKVGIIVPAVVERSIGEDLGVARFLPWPGQDPEGRVVSIRKCINSGATVRVAAVQAAGGYDPSFFLDYVDFDLSVRVVRAGYEIRMLRDVRILHELGRSEKVRFIGREFRYTRHSAERERMIARNIVLYLRRYHGVIPVRRDVLSLAKHFVMTALFDEERGKKLSALAGGTWQGLREPGAVRSGAAEAVGAGTGQDSAAGEAAGAGQG